MGFEHRWYCAYSSETSPLLASLLCSLFFSLRQGTQPAGGGIWTRVSRKALHIMKALEAFWRVCLIPELLLFLAVMWQRQALLACCWSVVFALACRFGDVDTPLRWSCPQVTLGTGHSLIWW